MERLFSAIPAVLNGLKSNANIDEAVVFAQWSRCAGEMLLSRTATVEFSRGRLVIAVQDNTWRRHLEELSPQLLVRINGMLGQGTVKFIEFRIDETAVSKNRAAGISKCIDSAPIQISPSLARAANAIRDENLRESFLAAAQQYLTKQRQM